MDPLGARVYFHGDFLMWWTKSAELPPLVTTSPAATPMDQAGVLGQDTTVLFGGHGEDVGMHPGARFTFGISPSMYPDTVIEAAYLLLGNKSADFRGNSANGDPILARPFFNTDLAAQDSLLVAFPDVATVSRLNVAVSNQLQSFGLLARQSLVRNGGGSADFLFGYRYCRFAERLGIDQSFISGPDNPLVPMGTMLQTSDAFAAANEFHGAELGIAAQTRYSRWSLEGLAKIALGGTRSRASIFGFTTVTVPGEDPFTDLGGLLAQPTNIGRYSQSGLSAIPEVGLTTAYDLTSRWRAKFGYTLLYWSRVARPGDEIDAGHVAGSNSVKVNVNPTQFSGTPLTGVPSPQFRFVTTDFWAQGLSLGLDCRF